MNKETIMMKTQELNPGTLLQTSGSYWETCTLHAAVKIDVFTLIGNHYFDSDNLAEKLGGNARGIKMLLDALAAMGLLEKNDVNEFLVTQTKECQSQFASYIMDQGDFMVDEALKVQNGKDGLILLHCEYPDGKFELLQKYHSDKEGKLIVGERHFSDTDLIGVFSGYFEESKKQSNWAA